MDSLIPNVNFVQPYTLQRCGQCHCLVPATSNIGLYCPDCVGDAHLCEKCYEEKHKICGTTISGPWFRYILIRPSTSPWDLLQCETVSTSWANRPHYLHLTVDDTSIPENDHVIIRDGKEELISEKLYEALVLLRRSGWYFVWVAFLCTDDHDTGSTGTIEKLTWLGASHRCRFNYHPVIAPQKVAKKQFDLQASFKSFATFTESFARGLAPVDLPPYHYHALEDVRRSLRLVKMEQTGSKLSMRILTTDLDTAPPYAALSYTWGASGDRVSIVCNGSTMLNITPNLACALHDLRTSGYEYMWIDAICINQQDLEEKSVQVSRMAEIYQRAKEVVVHLQPKCGNEKCHHMLAIDIMEKLASIMQAGQRVKTDAELLQSEFAKHGLLDLPEHSWHAWCELRLSPWFRRSWIVQESTVNRKTVALFHGSKIKFDTLLLANAALEREIVPEDGQEVIITRDNLLSIAHIRREQQADPYTHSLLRLVELSTRFNASNPRDKIFALLGLANDGEKAPPPNYELPLEQVLTDFASFCCQKQPNNCLHLLVAAGSRLRNWREDVMDLPSWAPTWNSSHLFLANQDLRTLAAVHDQFWNAGGFEFRTPRFDPDTKSMAVRAVCLGEIVASTSVIHDKKLPLLFEEKFNHAEFPEFCSEAMDIVDRHKIANPHPIEALVATVEAGLGLTMVSNLEKLNFLREASNRVSPVDLDDAPWPSVYVEDLAERMGAYTKRLYSMLEARRLAVTDTGLMCLVEYDCLPGDLICIIEGVRVPFVLRRKGDGSEVTCYCYVDGFMFGEILRGCSWGTVRIV